MAQTGFALLLVLQAVLLTTVSLYVGTHGWDDGAITLAFAQTFAQTGRIALTSVSEQVEGFSSTSWLLLNSIPGLFSVRFESAIRASQVMTIATLLATTIALRRLCFDLGLSAGATTLVLVSFAFSGVGFAEAVNGMEMGLLAAAGSYITHLYLSEDRRRFPLRLLVVICVFVSTRFEASFYMVFFATPLLFERRYREFLLSGAAAAVVFFLLGAHRWIVFDALLPNTVIAKMNAVYSPRGLIPATISRLSALTELPRFVIAPFGLIAVLSGPRLWRAFARFDRRHLYLLFPVLGVLTFSAIGGRNMGYSGRMQFVALPHALLLLGVLVDRVDLEPAVARARGIVFVALAVASVTASLIFAFPWQHVAAKRERRFEVTAETFRQTGMRVEAIRLMLQLPSIVFWTPDVGGLGLCCNAIRVVDVGLLTNRSLASKGYSAAEEVLEKESPEIIESHWEWTLRSRLYELEYFRANYGAALIGETRFYVRHDMEEKLLASGMGCRLRINDQDVLRDVLLRHRYSGYTSPEDDVQFLGSGSVLYIKFGDGADRCGT